MISEAVKLARRYPQFAVALLLLGAYIFGPYGPERVRLSVDRAKTFGLHLLRVFLYIMQTRNEASSQIASRLVPGSGNEAERGRRLRSRPQA